MINYNPGFCERLKQHCENGKSLESFCAVLRISPKVISEWYLEYPEFKEAVDMAPCLELLFWEMEMITALSKIDKDKLNLAKSRIDNLSKYVISPLKKNTYMELKETSQNRPSTTSGDLVKDLSLLYDKKVNKNAD